MWGSKGAPWAREEDLVGKGEKPLFKEGGKSKEQKEWTCPLAREAEVCWGKLCESTEGMLGMTDLLIKQAAPLISGESHCENGLSLHQPKAERKCSACQQLLFDLASAAEAVGQGKEQRLQTAQNNWGRAPKEAPAPWCGAWLQCCVWEKA